MNPRHDWLSRFAITRVHVSLLPASRWILPPIPAVTIRGALGNALMDAVCIHRDDPICLSCRLVDTCPIPGWYDPGLVASQKIRPFVIQVDQAPGSLLTRESPLRFDVFFFGSIPKPGLLLEAIDILAGHGLGEDRIPHIVEAVWVHGVGGQSLVMERGRVLGSWPHPSVLGSFTDLPSQVEGARLQIVTPLRLKHLSEKRPPSIADLLRSMVGRTRAVARMLDLEINRWWPEPHTVSGRWEWRDFRRQSRWSSRQGSRVDLSGWTGIAFLDETVADFADLLASAEYLHIGAKTSTGLGRVLVDFLA